MCGYLSGFNVFVAFYNLNLRINRMISGYLQHLSVGNDCCLNYFRTGCSILVHHQSSLLHLIRTLTISNRGSPLAARSFLSLVSLENMIYLEKLTFIEFTGHEILLYLDAIERNSENMFQYLTTLYIDHPQCIDSHAYAWLGTPEKKQEHQSILINQILTGNKYRFKSIVIHGDDAYM